MSTLNEAIDELINLRDKAGVPGDSEILDEDGFAISGFRKREFEEDDKKLCCKKGDIVVQISSLR